MGKCPGCDEGQLDFVFSESGVNPLVKGYFIDDLKAYGIEPLKPSKSSKIVFRYKVADLSRKKCLFVFRVFDPLGKKGKKYLVDLLPEISNGVKCLDIQDALE